MIQEHLGGVLECSKELRGVGVGVGLPWRTDASPEQLSVPEAIKCETGGADEMGWSISPNFDLTQRWWGLPVRLR